MLPFRIVARRSLSCSSSMLKKCKPPKDSGSGTCECQQPKKPCKPKEPKRPKGADRQCEASEAGPHGAPGPARDMGIPDHCCKENALECAQKLKALQQQWEAVAKACDPGERAAPKAKRPGCPVKPPAREEGGGISPVVVLFAGAALVAAIIWCVVNNKEESENGKDEENKDGEKKEGEGS